MNNAALFRAEILTGQFHTASKQDQQMIRALFGEDAEQDFEIYFHWYNIIHELGHAVMDFNAPKRPHPAEEEQLVNDFAVAYWRTYGETERLRRFSSIVTETLRRFPCPVSDGSCHIDYARRVWNTPQFMSFESYGWFQFSCTARSLSRPQTLPGALRAMGVAGASDFVPGTLHYALNQDMPAKIIEDAVRLLKQTGISLPKQIEVCLVKDPNCHMLKTYLLP